MKNQKQCIKLLLAVFITIALCCPLAMQAQSNLNFDMKVVFIQNDNFNYTSDTAKCIITVQDTVNIAKIHIKVTRFDNSKVVLDRGFSFDSNFSLPNGTTWRRKGKVITIVLGKYPKHIYDMQVALEDKSHNLSPITYFYQ